MKIHFTRVSMTILAIVVLSLFSMQTVFAGNRVKVVGAMNSDLQFVAENGNTYEIGEGEKGEELMNLPGSVVEVEGEVEEQDEILVLNVQNFKVVKSDS
ncbi:MAG: hypothetical protein HQ517_03575 [SAR324 cluster bacterium]|nr:hypothetical protein [SAR324 cluster bacterium]